MDRICILEKVTNVAYELSLVLVCGITKIVLLTLSLKSLELAGHKC